ncbi:hypothetical protein [Leifsonia poae]|uniref:hypothetical protein n=1 Tax=Leifsonia poae TaxID=110933 RepID=UPI003D67C653
MAWIPDALLTGWILLPCAFVLGVVAATLKDVGQGFAVCGVFISLAGAVVWTNTLFAAISCAFESC